MGAQPASSCTTCHPIVEWMERISNKLYLGPRLGNSSFLHFFLVRSSRPFLLSPRTHPLSSSIYSRYTPYPLESSDSNAKGKWFNNCSRLLVTYSAAAAALPPPPAPFYMAITYVCLKPAKRLKIITIVSVPHFHPFAVLPRQRRTRPSPPAVPQRRGPLWVVRVVGMPTPTRPSQVVRPKTRPAGTLTLLGRVIKCN